MAKNRGLAKSLHTPINVQKSQVASHAEHRVSLFREPDAGNPPVRFDEREQETAPCQTGLRRRGESQLNKPPGDYRNCACSRLYRTKSKALTAEGAGEEAKGMGL